MIQLLSAQHRDQSVTGRRREWRGNEGLNCRHSFSFHRRTDDTHGRFIIDVQVQVQKAFSHTWRGSSEHTNIIYPCVSISRFLTSMFWISSVNQNRPYFFFIRNRQDCFIAARVSFGQRVQKRLQIVGGSCAKNKIPSISQSSFASAESVFMLLLIPAMQGSL